MEKVINFIVDFKWLISLVLYILLCIPILFSFLGGLKKGFRKSLWVLIMNVGFLLLFILTVNLIAEKIYESSFFGLPAKLEKIVINETSIDTVTFKDLSAKISNYYLSKNNELNLDTDYVKAFVDSLVIYAIKVAWIILYFLIIMPLCRLILRLFIYNIFLKGKKEFNKANKDSLIGGLLGLLNGLAKSFVIMVIFSGFFVLIEYTGETEAVEENLENVVTSEVQEYNIEHLSNKNNDFRIEYLDGEEGNSSTNTDNETNEKIISILVNNIKPFIDTVGVINGVWNDNLLVKSAKSITITDKNTGESTNALYKCFDELVYVNYKVKDESSESNLDIKVNMISDLNSVFQAVLYIVGDDEIYNEENKIDYTKIKSARVEKAFDNLSNVRLMKVLLVVGTNVLVENYADQITAIDLTNKELLNQLYSTDFTQDLSSFGKLLGGLFELGLGDYLNKTIANLNNNTSNNEDNLADIVNIFGYKKDTETYAEFLSRVEAPRKKVLDAAKKLNIIDLGGQILTSYLFKNVLNNFIEKYRLNEVDLNNPEAKSYIDTLINSIDLKEDISTIFKIVFDMSNYTQEDLDLNTLINKYSGKETTEELDLDKVSQMMNTLLSDLSELTFLQSVFDIFVQMLSVSLENNEKFNKYLTSENLFSDNINWNEEVKVKVPNLVDAFIKSDIIKYINTSTNNSDSSTEENKSFIDKILFDDNSDDEQVLTTILKPIIDACFELKLVSNLEDTCLKPLLTELIESMSSDTFKIKVSDDLGEKQSFKDEILSFVGIFDDILDGAKEKGATSLNDLSSNVSYLIYGIANVNPLDVENSSILGPTMVSIISNFNNEVLSVPFNEDSDKWYTTYDELGNVVNYGELYNLIHSIDACKELISKIFNMSSSEEGTDILSLMTSIENDEIDELLKSTIIRATFSSKIKDIEAIEFVKSYYDDTLTQYVSLTETLTKEFENEDGTTSIVEYYILNNDELKNMLNGFTVLFGESGNLDNLSLDFISNVTSMPDEDLNSITSSYLINATLTSKLSSVFDESSSNTLVIPSNVLVEYTDFDSDESDPLYMISKAELKTFIKSLNYFDYKNMSNSDNSFSAIKQLNREVNGRKEISVVLDSEIIKATITDLITNMNMSSMNIIIPENTIENDDINYLDFSTSKLALDDSNNLKSTILISDSEVEKLVTAISYFDGTDLSSTGNKIFEVFKTMVNKASIKDDKLNCDYILDSTIIRASLSNYLMNTKTDAFRIYVPYSSLVLESNGSTPKLYKNYSSYNLDHSYIINKDELRKFIIGLSRLDTESLSNDTVNAIKALNDTSTIYPTNKEIEVILSSNILKLTMSNYLLDKSESFSLSGGIIYPTSIISEKNSVQYDKTNLEYNINPAYDLSETEIISLVNSLDLLELSNISNDPLNALNSLSSSEISSLLSSSIMHYTLSNQLIKYMVDNSYSFMIPEEAIEYDALIRRINYVYDSETKELNTKSLPLIKSDELTKLFNSIKLIDINNLSSELLINMNETNFNSLLDSSIIRLNIAKKFKESIDDSDYNDKYLDSMASNEITYKTDFNEANLSNNTIDDSEINALYDSLQIMGAKNIENMSISVGTIYGLDDSEIDTFISSIFLRNIVSTDIFGHTTIQEKPVIISDINSLYDNTKVLSVTDNSVTTELLSSGDLKLSYESPLLNGSSTVTNFYTISLNGDVLSANNPTNEYTIEASKLVEVGKYTISVTASNLSGLKMAKPIHYNKVYHEVSSDLVVAAPSLSENLLSIPVTTNADTYEINFYDEHDNNVYEKTYKSSKSFDIDLNGLFGPGKYYYILSVSSFNEAYKTVSSSIYNSKDSDLYYEVSGSLSTLRAEIDKDTSRLYFEKIDNVKEYKVTINDSNYTEFETEGNLYYLTLSTHLNKGLNNIKVEAFGNDYYDNKETELELYYFDDDITLTETLDSYNLSLIENATRYIVTVYKYDDEIKSLYFYKEYKINTETEFVTLSKSLFKEGYKYEINIVPENDDTDYISSTVITKEVILKKDLKTPYNLKFDRETHSISFSHDDNSTIFIVKLYSYEGELLDTKEVTIDEFKLMDVFTDYTFENKKYKLSVTAKSNSEFNNDSLESELKTINVKLTD